MIELLDSEFNTFYVLHLRFAAEKNEPERSMIYQCFHAHFISLYYFTSVSYHKHIHNENVYSSPLPPFVRSENAKAQEYKSICPVFRYLLDKIYVCQITDTVCMPYQKVEMQFNSEIQKRTSYKL